MSLDFLVNDGRDAPLVWQNGVPIGASVFRADVATLTRALSGAGCVVNFCQDRYAFLTTFAAALANRQVTLLPASFTEASLAALRQQHESLVAVTDETAPHWPVPVIQWESACKAQSRANATETPLSFEAEQPAAIVHTSGTTGVPRPHLKTWGMLVRRARRVGARLGLDGIRTIVATVPSQHMYGLENAIMLPLQHGVAVDAGRPFFPADVAAALGPESFLVTTPVHLKTLNQAAPDGLRARKVLSATAPLSTQQARLAESRMGAPVMEIYGSTEAGVVATRRTATTREWQLLDSLRLSRRDGATIIHDRDTGMTTELQDTIETVAENTFVLGQRERDMIKVAGKRASLAALTAALCSLSGVRDGTFLPPEERGECSGRPSALVVAPNVNRDVLLARLRKLIDPVFLPRPFVMVESLPRNATGKLPWEAARHLRDQSGAAKKREQNG